MRNFGRALSAVGQALSVNLLHNQVFAKNTKNEDSEERNVHIVHEHRNRRNDAVVLDKDEGYARDFVMRCRTVILISILILGVFYIFHVYHAAFQEAQHNQAYSWQKSTKINGYWQNIWLNTHKLLGKLYYGQAGISNAGTESNIYKPTSDHQTEIIDGKKLNSSSGVSGPYNSSDGSSSNFNESGNQNIANESGNQTYIYISENGSNDVIRCKLGLNNVSDCMVVLGGLSGPQNMVILKDKFYLLNYNQPSIYSCGLSGNGAIESCSQMTIPISEPGYMAYNNYKIFISNLMFSKMAVCSLDYDFSVLNCTAILPKVPQNSFAISEANGYQYTIKYDPHANYMGAVNKCVESSCSIMYDVNLSNVTTVKILNNTAYILDYNTDSLVGCKLQTNGDFQPCTVLKSGLRTAIGLAFYSHSS